MERVETKVSYIAKIVILHDEDQDPHEMAEHFNLLVLRDGRLSGSKVEVEVQETMHVVDNGIPF